MDKTQGMGDEQRADPGWYPAPDGTQRYWDGAQWLSIPPPDPRHTTGAAPRRRSRLVWPIVGVAVVVIVGLLVVVGFMLKADRDRELAAAAEAARAAEIASAQAAEEAASAQAAEEAAQRNQEREEDRERAQRQEVVAEIEASVETMAEGHVEDGIIDGPVLAVTCSPVAGGSIDDLTEKTTVFDCFVATEDHGDGTMSGIAYNATMNWSTGSYTYSIGAP